MTEIATDTLPPDWSLKPLADLVERTNQSDPRRSPSRLLRYVDVSSVSADTLRILGWTSHRGADAPSRARKQIRHEDVLFATVRPRLRRLAQVPPDLDGEVCSTAFTVLRANPKLLDSAFLFYAVADPGFVARVSRHERGSGYPAVRDGDVLREVIAVPPLAEQGAIAHVLRTVQRAREATEQVTEAVRELKRSLVRDLFTWGTALGRDGSARLHEGAVGPVPESWETRLLKEMVEKPQYGYTATATEDHVGPRFLRITDIQDGRVRWESVPFCECSPQEVSRYQVEPGDVLVARIGATTGKAYFVGEVPDSAVFASYLIRLRTTEELLPEFLGYFTQSPHYWEQINVEKGGRLKTGVNAQTLSNLVLRVPPLEEQRQVVRVLSAVDATIAGERERGEALDTLFKSLLCELLTAKRRVSPDLVSDVSEASA